MVEVIVRKDNWPYKSWRFQDVDTYGTPLFDDAGEPVIMDLTGSEFILTINGKGVRLVLTTEDNTLVINHSLDILTWPITQSQAIKFLEGVDVPYDIQRVIDGKYQTMVASTFVGGIGPAMGTLTTVVLQGPVGPEGDVTQEALDAKEAAEAAAVEAAASAASVSGAARTIASLGDDRARNQNDVSAAPFVVDSERSPRHDTLRDLDPNAWNVTAGDEDLLRMDTLNKELKVEVPLGVNGGMKFPAGVVVTEREGPSFDIVNGRHRILAASGELLIDLDADEASIALRATAKIPTLTGGLWRRQNGVLVSNPPIDDLVIGMPRYQTITYRDPLFPETPVIIFADEEDAEGLNERVFQGIPTHCCVGAITYYVYYGDNVNEEEIAGNYCILARRVGDVVTEIAYIKHPNAAARTLDPFLFLDDQGVMHLLLTVTSDVTGSHDFFYGVWTIPITDPLSPMPRFGQWRRPLPYGIAGRPTKFGTRWLVPVDCRETSNSPLYDANASGLGLIGKYLFEFIPQTGEFLQVNRFPAALANNSWQESSVIFMRDGTYVHSWRTASGPYIAVCPDGPEVPATGSAWTSLSSSVESRHDLKITPKGRSICVYNAGPDRTNLTVKMWAAGKLPTESADRTLLLSGALAISDVSYPHIDFDASGNVAIVADNNRFISDGDMQIIEWRLNEDNLYNGSISANPTPFVVNLQEA